MQAMKSKFNAQSSPATLDTIRQDQQIVIKQPTALIVVAAINCLLAALAAWLNYSENIGWLWAAISLIWGWLVIWYVGKPLVRITQTGLIRPKPFHTRTIPWSEIRCFYVLNRKIEFVRKKGSPITIPIPPHQSSGIELLVNELEKFIPRDPDKTQYMHRRKRKALIRTGLILLVSAVFVWALYSVANNSRSRLSRSTRHFATGLVKYRFDNYDASNDPATGECSVESIYVVPRDNYPDTIDSIYLGDCFVPISDDWAIDLSCFGFTNINACTKFGLRMGQPDRSIFRWEWYDRVGDRRFQKRKGTGELDVQYEFDGRYWTISKITLSEIIGFDPWDIGIRTQLSTASFLMDLI